MKLKIKTDNGVYRYKFIPIYPGIKPINKTIAFENLMLLKKICDANNLHFLIYYGTLLGAIREKDFITHDEDIDLALKLEDMPHFLNLLFELRKNGFEMARYESRGFMSIIRKGEYIDLYFFGIYPKNNNRRYCARDVLPKKFIEETKNIEFKGETFETCADPVGFLELYYGEDWKTPQPFFDFNMSKLAKFKMFLSQYIKALLPQSIVETLQAKRDAKYLDRLETESASKI